MAAVLLIWTLQSSDFGSLAFWIPVIVAAIGIPIGVIVAFYFYRKSKRFKRPVYAMSTRSLIRDFSATISGLKVEFMGVERKTISVTRVGLWNEGTETIDKADVASADPLRILCPEGEILDYSTMDLTSPANVLGLQSAGTALVFAFDYLDKYQGGVFQIIHTSTSDFPLLVVGSVKGSEPLLQRGFEPNAKLTQLASWLMYAAVGTLLLFVITIYFNSTLSFYSVLSVSTILFVASLTVAYLSQRVGTVPKRFASVREFE